MESGNPKLDQDQQLAVCLVLRGYNVFATGKAGTGKSTVLRAIRNSLPGEVVHLAPTGMAARNIQGTTIHRFFSFPPTPLPVGYVSELDADQVELLSCIDTIVIDEVSMVRSDVLAAIDTTLRHYAPAHMRHMPFGRKQLVMVGDFFQLPPVVRTDSLESELQQSLGGHFAFGPPAWQLGNFLPVELKQAHRQAADQPFLQALDCIRRGGRGIQEMTLADCLGWFNTNAVITPAPPDGVTALCTTRARAMSINHQEDMRLAGPLHATDAEVWGSFPEDDYPTERYLQFRTGSRVMLVANAPLAEGAEGFVNGDTGHVLAYSPEEEKAEIELDDGRRVMVGRFMWTQEEYRVSWRDVRPRLERYTVGWFSQLPLRLAYAMTIHKAQGLTFDRAHIELGRERGTFAGGQLYTALSRCRSLAGLTLNRALRAGDVLVDPDVVAFYENLPALSTPVPATECHT